MSSPVARVLSSIGDNEVSARLVPEEAIMSQAIDVNDHSDATPRSDSDQVLPEPRPSDTSLIHAFGRMRLNTPHYSVMTMPLTPEIYTQGLFSDPKRRLSYDLNVGPIIASDNIEESGIRLEESSGYAGARLQGMPQLPTPPRYDGTTANEKKFMQLYQDLMGCPWDRALPMRGDRASEDEWIAYFFQGNELGSSRSPNERPSIEYARQ
ncbi:hypothetical protein AC1031_005765 [Aphanomyces cochlioides]|nr:hypothetical protein AC1031_005765 [Aphanomyces cochlioides]